MSCFWFVCLLSYAHAHITKMADEMESKHNPSRATVRNAAAAYNNSDVSWESSSVSSSVPLLFPGKQRELDGSLITATAKAINKKRRYGNHDYFSDNVESQGREPITMPQSLVVFTCQLEKKIGDKRADEVARNPTVDVYAPASATNNVHVLKKGNLVFTTYDSLTDLSARISITALGTVSVSDNVNNLLRCKKIQFVGCVESESDSNDGKADTSCTISIAGTITTVNTGPSDLYPGQKVYAIPHQHMVKAGHGRKLPYVLPAGQPSDKFLLSTVAITDDTVFTLLRSARSDIQNRIKGIEKFQANDTPEARLSAFSKLIKAFVAKKRSMFTVTDEALLTDYITLYGVKTLILMNLTGHPQWAGESNLTEMLTLGYRALVIFTRDRAVVVNDFYKSVGIPGAQVHKLEEIKDLKIEEFDATSGITHAKRQSKAAVILNHIESMMEVAREEMVSFLDRMCVGRVMNFSKVGGALDVLMGAK